MTAYEYLKSLPREYIPRNPSNSELWRWLANRSIAINGKTPVPKEEIEFPINKLVFFHNDKKVTLCYE